MPNKNWVSINGIHIQLKDGTPVVPERILTDLEKALLRKGDKGDQGIQGIPGINGIPGIQGEKGDRGEKGEQGISGVLGSRNIDGGNARSIYLPTQRIDGGCA